MATKKRKAKIPNIRLDALRLGAEVPDQVVQDMWKQAISTRDWDTAANIAAREHLPTSILADVLATTNATVLTARIRSLMTRDPEAAARELNADTPVRTWQAVAKEGLLITFPELTETAWKVFWDKPSPGLAQVLLLHSDYGQVKQQAFMDLIDLSLKKEWSGVYYSPKLSEMVAYFDSQWADEAILRRSLNKRPFDERAITWLWAPGVNPARASVLMMERLSKPVPTVGWEYANWWRDTSYILARAARALACEAVGYDDPRLVELQKGLEIALASPTPTDATGSPSLTHEARKYRSDAEEFVKNLKSLVNVSLVDINLSMYTRETAHAAKKHPAFKDSLGRFKGQDPWVIAEKGTKEELLSLVPHLANLQGPDIAPLYDGTRMGMLGEMLRLLARNENLDAEVLALWVSLITIKAESTKSDVTKVLGARALPLEGPCEEDLLLVLLQTWGTSWMSACEGAQMDKIPNNLMLKLADAVCDNLDTSWISHRDSSLLLRLTETSRGDEIAGKVPWSILLSVHKGYTTSQGKALQKRLYSYILNRSDSKSDAWWQVLDGLSDGFGGTLDQLIEATNDIAG
jgi:hypothetical protein